ncbi:unnamed protein product [Ceutorhynchus assimilis]|uniref:CRAL-TRIO domain-containing protein n=1 Tax=Ceutorhynchus assimilis TaxID=467358 RepID=A0A9N9QH81_9CUCU|nr:unnamed protein product [Ceutorhynchus assimilis]
MLQKNEEQISAQIYEDFGKTKQDLEEYIEILKTWTKTQTHFPEEPSYRVLRFVIIYNKFSIEKAKQRLDMYYTIRGLMPEFFKNGPFTPGMEMHMKQWQILPLPKPTEDHKRILYHKLNPEYGDPKYFDHGKQLSCILNMLEYLILEDISYRIIYILDLEGVTMGHVAKTSPMIIKKAAVIFEKVYANNVSKIYLINTPSYYDTVFNNIILPVTTPKIQGRIKLCSIDTLLEEVGKQNLPEDIGGDQKPLEELMKDLLQGYEKNRDRYEKLVNLRVDESLRPTKLENDDVLGYYGNFKKINVD